MPVNNLQEMIAYVKERPGKVSYGSSGYGTTAHIMMEMLKKATGMQITHVPYKGSAPMVIDLMAERVQFAFDTSSSILPQVKAGKLKTLGVSSGERDPVVPDVPTIAEQGVPGFDAAAWSGILAPAGTPAAVIEKLNAAANHALGTPEVKRHYALLGSLIDGGSADHFAQFLKKEQVKWGRAVKDSGAHMD
jgi:tripartite-type tricarboxylate transporter receptor subunit TctC